MPPASRGLSMLTVRNTYRLPCRRHYASKAPAKPPPPSQTSSAQLNRARISQIRPSDIIKTPVEAQAEVPLKPLTRRRKILRFLGWDKVIKRLKETKIARGSKKLIDALERIFYPEFIRRSPYLRYIRTFVFTFFTALPIAGFILLHSPVGCRKVTGPSMQPTINPDWNSDNDRSSSPSYVIIRKWDINYQRLIKRKQMQKEKLTMVTGDYERGDVIVYATPHDPEKIAIKRIVGVAGDLVTPLSGYSGGDEPVVVPFNHIWVEGDVNDRKKSVDSNYFGPIATGLIKGKVTMLWSPWWNIFGLRSLNSQTDDWPAKRQGRVKEDAVHDASIDPDRIEKYSAFTGERGAKTLLLLKERASELIEEFNLNEDRRVQVWQYWQRALVAARKHHDPEARQCARDIVDELEKVHGKNALKAAAVLHKHGKRQIGQKVSEQSIEFETTQDFESAKLYEDVRAEDRKARENPAWTAMEEMKKRMKLEAEMKDKEFAERDRAKEVREL